MSGASRIDAVQYGATSSRMVAALVVTLGSAVLVGWLADIAALKSILPGLATMKPNTALAFIFAGIALWCLSKSSTFREPRARLGYASAVVVALIAFLTLAEYAFGQDFGIDQLLFRDPPGSIGVTHPGRMSIVTALSFMLTASGVLLLDVEGRRGTRPSEWLP